MKNRKKRIEKRRLSLRGSYQSIEGSIWADNHGFKAKQELIVKAQIDKLRTNTIEIDENYDQYSHNEQNRYSQLQFQ